MLSPVEKLKQRSAALVEKTGGMAPAHYSEVQRITSMPLTFSLSPEEIHHQQKLHLLPDVLRAYESDPEEFHLHDVQINALNESTLDLDGQGKMGGFLPIGVGGGKTLIALRACSIAHEIGHQRVMLMIEPNLVPQMLRNIKQARTLIKFNCSVYNLHDKNKDRRRILARSKKSGLYIMPYSLLSSKDASDLLDWISPTFVFSDEVHNLGNRSSARSQRLFGEKGFFTTNQPEFIGASGTISSKSVRDYWHLITHALRLNSPLPLSERLALDWGISIDAAACSVDEEHGQQDRGHGPIRPLVDWARTHLDPNDPNIKRDQLDHSMAGFRLAYQYRLRTAPGVIVSHNSAAADCSLQIINKPADNKPNEKLTGLIKDLEDSWITPNGDEIDCPLTTYKWKYELSAGFYNELYWPEPDALRSRFPGRHDWWYASMVEVAEEHHALVQVYHAELRQYLKEPRLRLDTPMLVGQAFYRAKTGKEKTQANEEAKRFARDFSYVYDPWKEAHDQKEEVEGLLECELIERNSRAIRVDDYKIKEAVKWAKAIPKKKGAIIWYFHHGMGDWLVESLREELDEDRLIHCPAGRKYDELILEESTAKKICVASFSAHGTGKNLQGFDEMYFLQWTRPAKGAEQVIGRLHRPGQKADEVLVHTNNSTEFDHMNFAATLVDSLYIHQTLGSPQKLMICDWAPIPQVFPPEVLRQKGFDNEHLDVKMRKLFDDKFG